MRQIALMMLPVEVVNGVKVNELGQYSVTYKVKDSSGNESTFRGRL